MVPLISADELLERFRDDWQRDHGPGGKPKLVLVAASGGGIRAAVWTAAVLDGMERHVGPPGRFAKAVRLVTGASGGMVAGAAYAGARIHPTVGPSLAHRLAADSLWPTLQTLVTVDLPSAFLPFHRDWDRGRALEEAWHRNLPPLKPGGKSPFRATFAELMDAERAGLAPVTVFAPVLVEDGRRVLISNLDLGELAAPSAATAAGSHGGQAERRLLSRPAVEFFRLFPDAHARFEVGTAARLSATFPFVSPAVSLPTDPPRRVVDAGYYDNYGVGVAAGWLLRHRDAVRKYCGGAAVIEVRAFPLDGVKGRFAADGAADGGVGGAVVTALAGVSTPVEAVASVRAAAAYFRNDDLLGAADAEFNPRSGPPFFVRVPVECPVEAALSWAMASWDRDEIVSHFEACSDTLGDPVACPVSGFARWFGDG